MVLLELLVLLAVSAGAALTIYNQLPFLYVIYLSFVLILNPGQQLKTAARRTSRQCVDLIKAPQDRHIQHSSLPVERLQRTLKEYSQDAAPNGEFW